MAKPFLIALFALSTVAACDQMSTGPTVDPAANDMGEAINEPTDGAENEVGGDL